MTNFQEQLTSLKKPRKEKSPYDKRIGDLNPFVVKTFRYARRLKRELGDDLLEADPNGDELQRKMYYNVLDLAIYDCLTIYLWVWTLPIDIARNFWTIYRTRDNGEQQVFNPSN